MPAAAWMGCAVAALVLVACGSEVRDDTEDGGGGAAGPTVTSSSGTSTAGQGGGTSTTSSSGAVTSSTSLASTGQGGGPSFAACDTPGTCTLAVAGCCAPCDDPSLDDFDAIHVDTLHDHADAVCPEGGACPPCAPVLHPNLFAYCDLPAGVCVGADLPQTDLARCESSTECVLRAGTGCCEGCGEPFDEPWGWVALRGDAEADLRELLCDPDAGCPECAPEPPEGLAADCVEGVCTVVPLVGEP